MSNKNTCNEFSARKYDACIPSNKNISDEQDLVSLSIDSFLHRLRKKATESTYRSYKSTLTKFCKFYSQHEFNTLTVHHAGLFLYTLSQQGMTDKTLFGQRATVSNYLAFVWKTDPKILMTDISKFVWRIKCISERTITPQAGWAFRFVDLDSQHLINDVRSYLDQHRYGSRLHAFIETMIAARSCAATVRNLNLTDFDYEKKELSINLPNDSLVSKCNIVDHRTVFIQSGVADIIQTYIDTHNVGVPLFVTRNGRVSPETMRRSVRDCVDHVSNTPILLSNNLRSKAQLSAIGLSDIHSYALSDI